MIRDETLILGIGNTLLTDEGAGVYALNHLQSQHPELSNLNFVDGGTLSFTLAVWIEDCTNLIVFDATELHQPAGTVKTFVGVDMDNFLGTTKRSAHEVGLLDLMDITRLTNHLPENRALIGIQPEIMDWGMEPSSSVQKALDTAVNEAVTLINLWQGVNTDQNTSTPEDYRNSIKKELR